MNIVSLLKSEEIRHDINLMFEGNCEFLVKGLHVPISGPDSNFIEKYIEIKFITIPVQQNKHLVAIITDKTDVMNALINREEYISVLLNIIKELKLDNRETIYHLSSLMEIRDQTTGKHLERVEAYTRVLATEYLHVFSDRDKRLTESYVEDMAVSAVLHDIGKECTRSLRVKH
ncbi:MAG: hypothetical protein AB1798_02925 [Spirochaetota bacterium]